MLSGGAGEECGDDVGGVSVEGDAGSVVAHGGARVGVAGGFLHVTQWDAGVEGGGDERVAQRVRSHTFRDSGSAGEATHDPSRGVAIQPFTSRAQKDRAFATFPDREVDRPGGARCEGDRHDLAAFAVDREGPMPALETECFDVGPGGSGDP